MREMKDSTELALICGGEPTDLAADDIQYYSYLSALKSSLLVGTGCALFARPFGALGIAIFGSLGLLGGFSYSYFTNYH